MKNKYYLLLLLFNAICFTANAQNFEWLKTYGTKNVEEIISVCAEPTGTTVFLLGHSDYIKTGIDTLNFDSFSFFLPNKNIPHTNEGFLVRLDSGGKVLKARSIGKLYPTMMCRDDSGNFYISANFADTNTILFGSVNFKKANGNILFIKFDKNLNLKWIKQTGNSDTRANHIISSNKHIYFICQTKGKTQFDTATYNFANSLNFAFGELDQTNGNILWSNYFYNNTTNHVFHLTGLINLKGQLYFSGRRNSATSANNLIISGDTFYRGGFIIETDSIGNYKKRFLVHSTVLNNGIDCITSDGEFLYFGGVFTDSIKWGNKIIYSGYNNNNNYLNNFFAASLTTSFKPRWFFYPKIPDPNNPNTGNGSGYVLNAKYHNQFLYFSGRLYSKIVIDSQTFHNGNKLSVLIFKTDLRGNILWATEGGDNADPRSMDAIKEKGVYVAGLFDGEIKFGNYKDSSKAYDAFITKLSDNAIIRGQVKAGPYCAGDTLRIPYRKIGDYDTSNVFIAELSDADGNFTGGHRQLGRLKSNKDSVILARLPLFQVGSSEKYRIRILSTAPAVQSYYKVDTLRLLIYSKDKAFAGNDTTICNGDSVNLQTFGGTKWRWSPSYKLKDSTARKTPAWPDKTTRYKIIIADSSGCGMADTAYKTIVVRKFPSIQFHTPKDTSVCIGGKMPLIASFHGGDSTGYIWQWASIDSKSNYSFPRSGSGKLADTLLYTMPVNELDSMRFVLYLNDGCSPKTAFYNYTLKVKKQKPRARFNGSDTLVCPGKAIGIVARFDAGNFSLYSWTWQEQNLSGSWNNRRFGSNKGADTFNYTLSPLWQGKKKLRVLLKDQCTGLSDTAVYSLTPRDTLSLSLNNSDTTLCQGNQYVFKIKAKGGNPSTYQYRWINTNSQDTLSLTDSLLYKPKTSTALMVEVSDGCMQKSIQKTIQVDVFPILITDIYSQSIKAKDSTLCYGQVLKVYAQSSGGKGSGYNYFWKYNGINIGQKDSIAFTPSQSAVLELIGSDACFEKDTSRINITVLPKLESNIKAQDSLCLPSTLSLNAQAQGGKGNYSYQWLSSSNVLLGNKDSLQISYNDSSQKGLRVYKLILQDGCSSNDSTKINLHLLPGLSLALKTQDTCISSSTVLTAIASGGKGNKHQITWFKNGVFLGSGPSTSLNITAQSARYSAVLNDGCSKASDTASIRVYTKAQVSIKVSNPCYGDTSILKARLLSSNPISNYNWRIDNTNTSTIDSVLKLKFNNIGWHTIVLKAGAGQCVGKDSIRFNIIEKPKAAFDFTHLPNTNAGIPFQFNDRSLLANSWAWTFGTYGQANIKNPKFTFPDSGFMRIKLRVGKQNLCFDSTEQVIPIYERFEFFFPNAISIDGNGINDAFGLNPGQYPFVKTYQLKIFNRWGEKVFDSDVKEETFSSTRALQDVYVYKAIIKDIYNITHSIEGTLTVLK